MARPLAIPVIEGCGIDFFMFLLFGLLFLRTYARRAVLRTPPFLVERLRCVVRLEALKARHPFLKPILAYFLGSPGLGTFYPHMSSYLRMEGLESFTFRTRVLLSWSIMNLPFMFTPGASKDRFPLIITHYVSLVKLYTRTLYI